MALNLTAVAQGIDPLVKALPKIRKAVLDASYFATINAGEEARDRVVAEMRQKFDRPTPFILRSLRLTSASGGRIGRKATDREVHLGFVTAFEKFGLGTDPVVDTLEPQIEGGRRRPKPHELRLRRAGVLGNNEYLVPSRTTRLNRYGNVSQGEIVRMLSDLRTFNEAGFSGNSRYRRGRGHYVVLSIGGRRGIFRTSGGFGDAAVRNAKLIFVIVQGAPTYRKRLPFYEVATETFVRAYPAQFKRVLERQLKKAA